MKRTKLPEQLEIISHVLNDKNVQEIMSDVDEKINMPQMNAKVIGIMSELMKTYPKDADRLVQIRSEKTKEELDKLTDKEYAKILREAVTNDVLGFFG